MLGRRGVGIAIVALLALYIVRDSSRLPADSGNNRIATRPPTASFNATTSRPVESPLPTQALNSTSAAKRPPAAAAPPKRKTVSWQEFQAAEAVQGFVRRFNRMLKKRPAELVRGRVYTREFSVAVQHGNTTTYTDVRPVNATTGPDADAVAFCFSPRPTYTAMLESLLGKRKYPVGARHGELQSMYPLLVSLVDLGCPVRVARNCFDSPPPAGPDRTVNILDANGRELLYHSAGCRQFAPRSLVLFGWQLAQFPVKRTLLPYRHNGTAGAVGVYATCPYAKTIKKQWLSLMLGKSHQSGDDVKAVVKFMSKFVVVVATCKHHCASELAWHNTGPVDRDAYARLLAMSVVLVGVGTHAPLHAPSIVEALACGTFVVCSKTVVPTEFHAHPLFKAAETPAEVMREVSAVLAAMGHKRKASLQQPKGPRLTAAQTNPSALLDERFTVDGHRAHTQKLFGLGDRCTVPRDGPPGNGGVLGDMARNNASSDFGVKLTTFVCDTAPNSTTSSFEYFAPAANVGS